jgi:hypothetical protein
MLCLCNVPCFLPFEVVTIFVKFRVYGSGFMVQGLWFSWVCEDVTDLCKGQGLCFSYVFEVVTNFCEAQGFMVLKGM